MLRAAIGCFVLAVVVGMYLVAKTGWPILAVGLVSVVAGYAYTGGPYPLAYHGLGDLFVLVFFGLVAVAGSYYVQAEVVTPVALVAGLPVGALGVALLSVNNLRDFPTDAKAGKRTLVVRLGPTGGKAEFIAMVALAFLVPVALFFSQRPSLWVLLPLLSLPLAVPPLRKVLREQGPRLNLALGETSKLMLAFGLLFAIGLWRSGQ